MLKYTYIIYFLLLIPCTVFGQSSRFNLNGITSPENNGQTVLLINYKTNNDIFRIDSVVIREGRFQFEGNEYLDGISIVKFKDGFWMDVILESGVINLNSKEYTVRGTRQNDIYQNYIDSIRSLDAVNKLIIENQSELVGKIIFVRSTRTFPPNVFDILCSNLSVDFKKDPLIISAIKEKNEYDQLALRRKMMIGTKLQDIALLNTKGENVQLSNYIGNAEYVYLDLWASWCGPCLEDIPNLKKIYEKYRGNGIKMIGISFDEESKNWLRAINKYDVLAWEQLLILQSSMSQVKKILTVTSLPDGILLNGKGEILDIKMTSSKLEAFLENHE
jgi:thiol-disulfide isomerase/thioredoxin